MRIKHNKKRNTAFVYEALIVEATISILKKKTERHNKVLNIIKKHFKSDSALKKDLECYRALYKEQNLQPETSKRIIREARLQRALINSDSLFEEQTALIHDINKNLGTSIFNNFVPNYKSLATIAQIFSTKTSPKNQIILENTIVEEMRLHKIAKDSEEIDNITYIKFVEKFNEKYDSQLLSEQKELLMHYVSSFADNALSLKIFLNEEINRLKEQLSLSLSVDEIKDDQDMLNKTKEVINKLHEYSKQPLDEDMLFTIMKTQLLVKEIYTDGDNS